jgi:hypothetical protein
MEGREDIAMDMVIGYRGLVGGTFVSLFAHLLTTDRNLKGLKWWSAGMKKNWPILLLTPVFMVGINRLSSLSNKGGDNEEQ